MTVSNRRDATKEIKMIRDIIDKIEHDLIKSFAELSEWLDSDNCLLDYASQSGGWTIRQIVEHVSLTNHYLLILIQKGTLKAIQKAVNTDYADLLVNYELDWEKLKTIGEHKSFEWNRPEHMEPTNTVTMSEIKSRLHSQMQECQSCLHQMPNGEGVLYRTMMSVNNLGKIDVYHYISFLVQHIKRHITQMEKIKEEFLKN